MDQLNRFMDASQTYLNQHDIDGQGADNNFTGKPEILSKPLLPVPTLAPELIPEPLRNWIMDISYRMQTPPDFATVTAIAVISSLIGTACTVRPKQKDDWGIVPNLWAACVGRPSVVLKSPSMKEAINMLGLLQAKAIEEYATAKKEYEFDAKVQESQSKELDREITKATKSKDMVKLDYLRTEYANDDGLETPVCRLFKTNETSIQSQTILQKQNPRGLLTFRDEIMGLMSRWDKGDHEDERAYFLEGWNGDGSYTDFKIGRGLTEADNICISLLGGIQPDKLKRYLSQAIHGENDGLVQRLQLAVYPDEPKNWELIDQYPDTKEKERVFAIMEKLADADFTEYGAIQNEFDKFPYLRFSLDAQEIFNHWLTSLQYKLPTIDNPLIAEHLGKYRSLIPSLALIFHLITLADGETISQPISAQATRMAVAWGDYLEAHAMRIYNFANSNENEAVMVLSERLHKLPNPFTAKDVYNKRWHLLKDRAEVETACNILIESSWLKIEQLRKSLPKGGRPALPKYFINPTILEK